VETLRHLGCTDKALLYYAKTYVFLNYTKKRIFSCFAVTVFIEKIRQPVLYRKE